MVHIDAIAWASLKDVSGHYGATEVQCERVTFGGDTGRSVTWWRYILRGLQILERL